MDWTDIRGYVTRQQAEIFKELISGLPDDSLIVEIGSLKGRSSVMMGLLARELNKSVHILSVDNFSGCDSKGKPYNVDLNEFLANIQKFGLGQVIFPIVGDSIAVAETLSHPIDLWFYDAGHTNKETVDNFNKWRPLLKDGATVVFHNYDWTDSEYNVREAVDSLKLPYLIDVCNMAVWKVKT